MSLRSFRLGNRESGRRGAQGPAPLPFGEEKPDGQPRCKETGRTAPGLPDDGTVLPVGAAPEVDQDLGPGRVGILQGNPVMTRGKKDRIRRTCITRSLMEKRCICFSSRHSGVRCLSEYPPFLSRQISW